MMNVFVHLSREKKLRKLGLLSPEKRRLRCDFIMCMNMFLGGNEDEGTRFFSLIITGRTRSSGHKLKH